MRAKVILFLFANFILIQANLFAQDSANNAEDLVRELYSSLTINNETSPDWNRVSQFFDSQARIILRSSATEHKQMDVDAFIADFKSFIANSNVLETGFSETILNLKGHEYGNTAWYSVVYEAKIHGSERKTVGVDHFSLVKFNDTWKIISIVNEVSTPDRPIPEFLKN